MLHPQLHRIEGILIRHAIHQKDAHCRAIVGRSQSAELFLTSSIPYLDENLLFTNIQYPLSIVQPHSILLVLIELILAKLPHDRRLAHIGIANQYELDHFVVLLAIHHQNIISCIIKKRNVLLKFINLIYLTMKLNTLFVVFLLIVVATCKGKESVAKEKTPLIHEYVKLAFVMIVGVIVGVFFEAKMGLR